MKVIYCDCCGTMVDDGKERTIIVPCMVENPDEVLRKHEKTKYVYGSAQLVLCYDCFRKISDGIINLVEGFRDDFDVDDNVVVPLREQ